MLYSILYPFVAETHFQNMSRGFGSLGARYVRTRLASEWECFDSSGDTYRKSHLVVTLLYSTNNTTIVLSVPYAEQ